MTQEEKARRYDEAIERAKKINREHSKKGFKPSDDVMYIFPELKESEDGMIRKWIIDDLRFNINNEPLNNSEYKKKAEKAIAWLEKQDKKVEPIESFNSEFERQISHIIASTINKEYEYTEAFVKYVSNTLLNYAKHEIEKQGEQKQDVCAQINLNPSEYINDMGGNGCYLKNTTQNPVEWFEPKFHDGDWVTDDNGETVFHIIIDKNMYQLETIGGTSCHFSYECIEKKFRLWTIQDVKDGDVLTNGEIILIFKQFEEPAYRQHIIAYVGLDISGNIQVTDGYWKLGIDKASPATKEQCDLLFQKMHETGYEWDAEKKELKKI